MRNSLAIIMYNIADAIVDFLEEKTALYVVVASLAFCVLFFIVGPTPSSILDWLLLIIAGCISSWIFMAVIFFFAGVFNVLGYSIKNPKLALQRLSMGVLYLSLLAAILFIVYKFVLYTIYYLFNYLIIN